MIAKQLQMFSEREGVVCHTGRGLNVEWCANGPVLKILILPLAPYQHINRRCTAPARLQVCDNYPQEELTALRKLPYSRRVKTILESSQQETALCIYCKQSFSLHKDKAIALPRLNYIHLSEIGCSKK